MLSKRYRDNPWVIGADLRNEIRAIPGEDFSIKLIQSIDQTWKHSASKIIFFA
jgi:hypothetical protein